MQRRKISPLHVAPAIASFLLALGVATAFAACDMQDDGSWMRCHLAQEAIMWVAIAMTVILAVGAFSKNGKLRAVTCIVGAVGSAVTFAIPGMIVPMCMMQTMRCYEIMQPFARIMSCVILALCIVSAISSWHDAKTELLKHSL